MAVYRIYFSLFVLCVMIASSCKKQVDPPSFHYNYFDLTPGRYIDYDVMEIVHDVDQAIEHDTVYYQLRTLIGDTIIDNEGRVARKFIRYTRTNASSSWVLSDIWTAIIEGNRAEVIEENQRIIKLIFAPTASKVWNPNAYNMFEENEIYYGDIHVPITLGSLFFDSTLVVIQEENEPSFIDYKNQFEVYAKGVGLVKKYFKDLRQITSFDTLNIQQGNESFYTCIGYGIQ